MNRILRMTAIGPHRDLRSWARRHGPGSGSPGPDPRASSGQGERQRGAPRRPGHRRQGQRHRGPRQERLRGHGERQAGRPDRRDVLQQPAAAGVLADARQAGGSTEQGTEDRYFILLFEDQKDVAQEAPAAHLPELEAAKRARGWVRREMLPNDWVAVVSYDTRLKVQQDFTRDRKALVEAIGDATKGKDRGGQLPLAASTDQGPSLSPGCPRGTSCATRRPRSMTRSRRSPVGRQHPGPQEPAALHLRPPRRRDDLRPVRARQALLPADGGRAERQQRGGLRVRPDAAGGGAHALERLAQQAGGRHRRPVLLQRHQLLDAARPGVKENNGYYLLSYQNEQPAGKSGFQEVR